MVLQHAQHTHTSTAHSRETHYMMIRNPATTFDPVASSFGATEEDSSSDEFRESTDCRPPIARPFNQWLSTVIEGPFKKDNRKMGKKRDSFKSSRDQHHPARLPAVLWHSTSRGDVTVPAVVYIFQLVNTSTKKQIDKYQKFSRLVQCRRRARSVEFQSQRLYSSTKL